MFSRALRFVATAAIVYVAAAGLMYAFQRDLLFRPSGMLTSPQQNGLEDVDAGSVEMRDGTPVAVWRKAPSSPEKPTVLYFHGNAGNLTSRAERYRQIIDSGMGLYAPTYRGFAGSGGTPSESALVADALEHFDRASRDATQIVLYGESLGSGVAVAVAAQRDAKALLLEAPFTAAMDVASSAYPWLPVSLLMKDPFLSREKIGSVDEPLLVLHGTEDGTIPFTQGQALYDMANEPKTMVMFEGAGHNNLWAHGLWPAAMEFLNHIGTNASADQR
ncbi:alpha/beta hydrolase [Hoeflea sp. TYP-13]|uniref:alpha/beta hydrolase n=1 Tax=Hoeflea sp. TYP-13 TaxID=3230023 RepID=UPI0034C676DA